MRLDQYILELKDLVVELLARVETLEARLAKLEPKPKTKAEATHA